MEHKKIIVTGKYEDVIEIKEHFYIISKNHRIAILPYTIDSRGLLDKIGVTLDYNYVYEKHNNTLLYGYINEDDNTNLTAANRIFFEKTGINIKSANRWMFLGGLYNNLTSDSIINIYSVLITDDELDRLKEKNKDEFNMIDSSYVITSDDTLLLASYLRLFNYFYVNSLNLENKSNE